MALFKILKGNRSSLPSTKTEGYMYITKDTGESFVDISNTERIQLNALKAKQNSHGLEFDRVYTSMIPYGTEIPINADLNTIEYLKVGNYYCSKNDTVKTFLNCPTKLAFMMQVFSPLSVSIDNEENKTWVYRLRKIMTHKGEEYFQFINSGATAGTFIYGDWISNINSSHIATLDTPGIIKSGGDITVSSTGIVQVNDDSHNHIISNIDNLQTILDGKQPSGSYVITNGSGVQTIQGGLNIGGTPTSGTGAGRIIVTGANNPLFGLQATDSSGKKLTPYYLQVASDVLYLGPTSTKAMAFESEGNITMPSNLVVKGTISGNIATTSVNGLMSATDKQKLDNLTISIKSTSNAELLSSEGVIYSSSITKDVDNPMGLSQISTSYKLPKTNVVKQDYYAENKFTPDKFPLLLSGIAGNTATTSRGEATAYLHNSIYAIPQTGELYASKVWGAVWNDYAEFRITTEEIEPGRVVVENGDDTLSLSIERMQPGANIVSDTYGMAIGKTEDAQTPIAVSGRVLAYPLESKEQFHPGDAVCSGPRGTVSLMTRDEIREYPERIIGTVSAIPEYETWGSCNVKVNGRIWIKVK